MEKNCAIILSGGVDSTTLLHQKKDVIALAISFNYGSNHNNREIECAKYQCNILGIEHITIPLDFIANYFHSSLLEGADKIPEGNYADDNMRSTVVPFRNGIMLSVAAGIAESRNLDSLLIANHGGDHAIYPDCRPGFIEAMSHATRCGTYNNVEVIAPYTFLTKKDIVEIGVKLGIDYSHTYSCYKGNEKHCGRCGTCVERRDAFMQAGAIDGVKYED